MHNSRKKRMLRYARFLVLISIALFIYGICVDLNNRYEIFAPVNKSDYISKEKNDNTVSITPSEGNEIVTDNNTSIVIGKDKDSFVNEKINSNVDQDAFNSLLRDEIEKEFDVEILYGDETKDYTIHDLTTIPITNSTVVYEKLVDLRETLKKYPNGMFREIKEGGIPLTIILINNYSNTSVTGVTDSSYNYAKISIAAIYPFDESFYHESYHYIERYLFKKGANYNSWDTLLPEGFTWGTIDGSLSYSNTFKEDAFFVNNYAQTSASEDRASTFEYMMADTKASCLNRNKIIWIKAVYMSRTIESVLDCVRPDVTEYWERFNEEDYN